MQQIIALSLAFAAATLSLLDAGDSDQTIAPFGWPAVVVVYALATLPLAVVVSTVDTAYSSPRNSAHGFVSAKYLPTCHWRMIGRFDLESASFAKLAAAAQTRVRPRQSRTALRAMRFTIARTSKGFENGLWTRKSVSAFGSSKTATVPSAFAFAPIIRTIRNGTTGWESN